MTLDLTQLVLLGLLASSVHWLVARSEIARPFWSRARGSFTKLLACAGCSGFWLGGIAGLTEIAAPIQLDAFLAPTWAGAVATMLQTLATAVLGVFVTPVFESLLLWGLRESAIEEQPNDVGAVPQSDAHSGAVTADDLPSGRRQS